MRLHLRSTSHARLRLAVGVAFAATLAAGAAQADPDPSPAEVIVSPVVSAESRFGAAIAAGDFTGDGSLEIAIADPREDRLAASRRGVVRIFRRTPFGWEGSFSDERNSLDARFGHALAFGDFDEDGREDLLIGAPGGNGQVGSVYLLYHLEPNTLASALQDGTYASDCGSSLAVGDFNGDGHLDFATGCPSQAVGGDVAAGEVRLGFGDGQGEFAWGVLNQDTAGVSGSAEAGDRFGASLASGDFNCDGVADLAVGVPDEGTGGALGAGVVQVFPGSAGGIPAGGNQLLDQENAGGGLASAEDDAFGHALAAGGFDDSAFDDCDDLAIGIPYDQGSSAGRVLVIQGSAGGLTPLFTRVVTRQDFVGVANAPGVQRLGLALLAGDFGRGVQDDLVLGMPGEEQLALPPAPGGFTPGVACIAYGGSGEGVFANGAQCIGAAELDPALAGDRSFGLVLAAIGERGASPAALALGAPDSGKVVVLTNTLFRDGFETVPD